MAGVNRLEILNIFASRFYPTHWSGSLADVLRPYLGLVQNMPTLKDPQIEDWVRNQIVRLENTIKEDQIRERRVAESFE